MSSTLLTLILREETVIIMTLANTYNTIIMIMTLRQDLILITSSKLKQIKFYQRIIEMAIENKIISDQLNLTLSVSSSLTLSFILTVTNLYIKKLRN